MKRLIAWFRQQAALVRDRKHHEDLDYRCRYWYGDRWYPNRPRAIDAWCPLCNPRGPGDSRLPGGAS